MRSLDIPSPAAVRRSFVRTAAAMLKRLYHPGEAKALRECLPYDWQADHAGSIARSMISEAANVSPHRWIAAELERHRDVVSGESVGAALDAVGWPFEDAGAILNELAKRETVHRVAANAEHRTKD